MNETMSLVLATAILAVGGLGLYMYKTSDDLEYDDYIEDDNSFDNNYNNDEVSEETYDDLDDDIYEKQKVRSRNKTKRSKKSGGTKRKY